MTKDIDALIAEMVKMCDERDALLATNNKADYEKAIALDDIIVGHIFDDLTNDEDYEKFVVASNMKTL